MILQAEMPTELATALSLVGIEASLLQDRCSELILCGSRAQNVSRPDSDWDLVAIGDGIPRRKRGDIDLIPISRALLVSPRWLESELAWHVKSYGVWLKGQPGVWVDQVRITERTLIAKQDRIQYRLDRISEAWTHLSEKARARYLNLLRRDLQRYYSLKRGHDVPSSPVLDTMWSEATCQETQSTYVAKLIAELPERLRGNVASAFHRTEKPQRNARLTRRCT